MQRPLLAFLAALAASKAVMGTGPASAGSGSGTNSGRSYIYDPPSHPVRPYT